MVELIINSNKYSRIVSPKIITEISDQEKERLIGATKEKLLEMHQLLLDSSVNTVSFDIYSSSRPFNYDKCAYFSFFINDSEVRINFRYYINGTPYARDYKDYSLPLITFHNGGKFLTLHYDHQLFSDFLELYPQLKDNLEIKLNDGKNIKDTYLSTLKAVGELVGVPSPVKVDVDSSSVDEVNVNNQTSFEGDNKKVSNITINGRTIKIITDDDITIVKAKKNREKQKRLGGDK